MTQLRFFCPLLFRLCWWPLVRHTKAYQWFKRGVSLLSHAVSKTMELPEPRPCPMQTLPCYVHSTTDYLCSTVCKLGALSGQVDVQGVYVKIGDFIKFEGFLVTNLSGFPREEALLRKSTSPENRQRSELFWASPFTMHLVCTVLICVHSQYLNCERKTLPA